MSIIDSLISRYVNEMPDIDREHTLLNLQEIIDEAQEKNAHLLNKTIDDINNEIYDAVEGDQELYNKLKDTYRFINDIDELHKGKYIRWFAPIANDEFVLTKGAIIVDIKDNIVLCKKPNINQFTKIKYDNTLIFQKLSIQEILILSNK